MNREDFPMLKKDLIYFDSGATSLKPNCVIKSITDYYENYSANSHRGDYDISLKVDEMLDDTRCKVKDFINASDSKEIIFTKGTTESMNMIIFVRRYFEHPPPWTVHHSARKVDCSNGCVEDVDKRRKKTVL